MEMNSKTHRFETEENGHISFADYNLQGDVLTLSHVEAPPALRGTGAAGRLMEHICHKAQAEGWKIRPTCGYARAWMTKHETYHTLIV